ncbi:MAG: hypothetical protein Q7J75_05980 [Rhodoferax sp.]|nr:hypothetical protein [Rhodoferax sp.]
MTPEQKARVSIDTLFLQAGWHVCDVANANIHASTSVAIREFPLNSGFGFADYLRYVNGKACGVIEVKKQGATPTGVELQSGRYAQGTAAGDAFQSFSTKTLNAPESTCLQDWQLHLSR